jgi:type IV pilus assembly protein PilB
VEFDDLEFAAQAPAVDGTSVSATLPADVGPSVVADLIAEILEATGLVASERVAQAKKVASTGVAFADALVQDGLAAGSGQARVLAAEHQLPYVDLGVENIEKAAVEAIPLHVLERAVALPYRIENDRLKIALADPSHVQSIDELRLATRYTLELGVASADDIQAELRRIQRASEAWERAALVEDELDVERDEDEDDDLERDDGVSDAPLVRLVNSIILQAAEDGASDLHFDPQDDALVVRIRVDGVLHEVQRVPKRLATPVITRLKVLAKLDIAERRKPQDGRISLNAKAAGRLLDIRVAVLPTVEGESVVMRLLDKTKKLPTLPELGFAEDMLKTLDEVVRRPTGAVLVTGPTGSGKTTTLYAALAAISRPEINVITVEDPVEYRMPGLNQVQVNPKAGLTFATALRSILRSDPDVIMVGEIRDPETAKMAIEAALTGHFVLSTLHTNDAPSVLTRLNEMGVEPFLTGSAVTAVIAQRLARRLCGHCSEMYIPTPGELAAARFSAEAAATLDGASLYRKRGCPRCNQTGYKGRVGIYQLMVMSESLERFAAAHASREELERAAIECGMKTLWTDGLEKVAAGMTSLEELGRVRVS